MLDAAAVIGARVDHDLLATVARLPAGELTAAIRECVDAQLLRPIPSEGRPAYAFRHDLVQEALYDEVLPAERVAWHAAIAMRLAEQPDRVAELAHHARQAMDLPLALESSIRAASAAEQVFAFGEARRHYERALEIWGRIPEPEGIAGIDHTTLLERAAAASANSGETARAAQITRRVLDTLEPTTSTLERARLFDLLYWYSYESSNLAGMEAAARAPLAFVPESTTAERALVLANLGHHLWSVGRHADAARWAREAVEVARAVGDVRAEARGRIVLTQALTCLGETSTADETAQTAAELFESIGDYDGKSYALMWWATTAEYGGEFDAAAERAIAGLATARQDGTVGRYGDYLATIAYESMIELGRWDEASIAIRSALAQASDSPAAIWLRSDLARLLIYRGRLDEARSHLERGARIAAAGPDRVWQLEETVIFKFADGRDDDARRAVDDIIQGCPEPERDMTLWWSLVGALRGEVRRLEAARARRDDADADETLAVARSRLALLRLSGRSAKETGGAAHSSTRTWPGRMPNPRAWTVDPARTRGRGRATTRADRPALRPGDRAAARSGGPASVRRRADGGRGAPGSRAHHRGAPRGGAVARRDRRG